MAELVTFPEAPGPVNEGERRVIAALVDRLPADHTVYPSVQIVHRDRVDDCDVLVITPDVICVVEVKDLAGEVHVGEREFSVDGMRRAHPYIETINKAKRLKSRLADADAELRRVWVAGLVVLAREPRRLHLDPLMRDKVVDIDRAVELLTTPGALFEHPQAVAPVLGRVRQRLNLNVTPRAMTIRLGAYEVRKVLGRDGEQRRYLAEHELTGREAHLLQVLIPPSVNAAEAQQRREHALREVRALERLGRHPNLPAPREVFQLDDGSLVIVSPVAQGVTLADALGAEVPLDDEQRLRIVRDVASALAHVHAGGLAHRRVGPSAIELGSDGVARLGSFQFAKLPSGESLTVSPASWGGVVDDDFLAPEQLADPAGVGAPTDLWALGRLVKTLWPDPTDVPLPELALATRTLCAASPEERRPTAAEVAALCDSDRVPELEVLANPEPDDLSIGDEVDGFLIEAHLGSGATSSVWKVYEPLAGTSRALKLFTDPAAEEPLTREYRVLDRVQHPNVVRVLRAGRCQQGWYLLTELLEGPTLATVLDEQGALGIEEALDIADGLARALVEIHPSREGGDGIVHRDLKPDNVVLVEGRGPVLFDFGIASGGGSGSASGTAAYRPADRGVDAADPDVDLFALGVVVHELLTGRHPYPERDTTRTPRIDESIPATVAAVLVRACAPKREDRFDSATQLVDAIAAARTRAGSPPPLAPEPVRTDNKALYAEIRELIRVGDLDTAETLCPPHWTQVLETIEKKRRQRALRSAPAPTGTGDVPTASGFVIELEPEQPVRVRETLSGERDVEASALPASIRCPGGAVLRLRYVGAENGERWVDCTAAENAVPELERLVHGLRLGVRELDDELTIELGQARLDDDGWSNVKMATSHELDAGAGVDVRKELMSVGATAFGTRAEMEGVTHNRRNYLCVTFPPEKPEVAILAYVLTRVAPIVDGVKG